MKRCIDIQHDENKIPSLHTFLNQFMITGFQYLFQCKLGNGGFFKIKLMLLSIMTQKGFYHENIYKKKTIMGPTVL